MMENTVRDDHNDPELGSAERFGRWLLNALQRRGVRQEDLAMAIDVSPSYVSTLVRASPHGTTQKPRRPKPEIVERMARYLWRLPVTAPHPIGEELLGEREYVNVVMLKAGHAPVDIYDYQDGQVHRVGSSMPISQAEIENLLDTRFGALNKTLSGLVTVKHFDESLQELTNRIQGMLSR